jgi:hypothetical protein
VKHILRYVAGTLDYGVLYRRGKKGDHQLIGYSDSDYAGDIDDRKSTSGMLFCLGSSPITWNSGKQKVVALSSCEAEYVAATYGACQGVWLARLLKDLVGYKSGAPTLRIDNKSGIDLAKKIPPTMRGANTLKQSTTMSERVWRTRRSVWSRYLPVISSQTS